METWDDALAALRVEYLREAPGELEALSLHIERLAQARADRNELQELRRAFHSLSGAGRTYGLPRVSELGRRGDFVCAAALKSAAPATDSDLESWRTLLAELRQEFAQAGVDTTVQETAKGEGQAPPSPADILVIDDHTAITQLLSGLLHHEGMAVRTAASGREGRAALDARLPDGLIVDALLPDGSGYKLVEHLRGLPGGDVPPVIMVNVRTAFGDRVEAIHCGADAYFGEPLDEDALLRRLTQLLETRRAQSLRVLSVEDDPHQAAFLRAVLESGGCQVRVCSEPQHFESDLASFQPDLVLMDVVLPGVSGYDLVRYLRQDERYATLPVLVLTAESYLEARIQATRSGADDYIVKPVSPGLLLAAVASRIERARFLKSLLERDGLTRLLTHTALVERARAAAARHQRAPTRPMVWAMLDLDKFKSVNDRFGHPVGDRVLVSIASLLRRRLRQADTVGRYGGEEFAVVLEDLSEGDAIRLFERLREEFAAVDQRAPDGTSFRVTFSCGLAMLDAAAPDLNVWRKAADDALLEAKRSGRNRVVTAPSGGVPAA